ncbi:hypothetical protein NB693_23225 [Pantoea ananatis]|nr:hypothetical protein [Pantoea ananatis]
MPPCAAAGCAVAGDLPRLRHRFLDRARGDFGEHHPVQRLALEQPALLQDLGDVPADRLALAVRVGRQVDVFGRLGRLGDGLHVLLVLVDQRVAHREAVVRIHCAFFRDQVAHVPIRPGRGNPCEVFVDRLGLGGRFDDEQVLGHGGRASMGVGRRDRHRGGGAEVRLLAEAGDPEEAQHHHELDHVGDDADHVDQVGGHAFPETGLQQVQGGRSGRCRSGRAGIALRCAPVSPLTAQRCSCALKAAIWAPDLRACQVVLVGRSPRRCEDAVLLQEQQEAAAFHVELVQFRTVVDADRAIDARLRHGRALVGQGVEPVERLADLGGAETGLDQAILEGVAIADRIRVFAEIVFEQVQQDIQNALFIAPRPASRDAVEVLRAASAASASIGASW